MSGGPLLKHLASTLLPSRAFTLTRPFPSRFFTTRKPRYLSRPNSLAAANISTSSSETPSAQPFALPFQSVNIRCQRHVSDMLQEALLCFGASSTSVDEDDDYEDSDEICITSIFPEGEDVNTCISCAADSISLKEIPSYEVTIGEQYDWIKKTQESFHPVEITEGLWIVPAWKTPPDAQATNIILNPGLAFGTGEHPTTRLCLLLLHGLIKGGEQFLDYGTGSGILAIAAVKFGAALAVGIDIDPQAITSAHQNATLNNIGPEQMQLYLVPSENCSTWTDPCGNVEERSTFVAEAISETDKYDVLIANILLNPLMDLADQIVSYAKPGAVIGLSGILSDQGDIHSSWKVYRLQRWMVGPVSMAERSKMLLATEESLPSKPSVEVQCDKNVPTVLPIRDAILYEAEWSGHFYIIRAGWLNNPNRSMDI